MKNVIITILAVLVVALGCYLVYDKFVSKQPEKKNNCIEEKIDNDNRENNNGTYQVLELSPFNGHAVLYNGEVYVNLYPSAKTIDEVYGEGTYQSWTRSWIKYQSYSFDKLTVSLAATNASLYGKWLKLDVSNVKSIYNNEYGQAMDLADPKYSLIMLNNDNTVSYISIKDVAIGNTSVQKLEISDIESVVSENNMGYTTYVVDSDNNRTDINDLIK